MIAVIIIAAGAGWSDPAACSAWLSDNAAARSACAYERRKHQEKQERELEESE